MKDIEQVYSTLCFMASEIQQNIDRAYTVSDQFSLCEIYTIRLGGSLNMGLQYNLTTLIHRDTNEIN